MRAFTSRGQRTRRLRSFAVGLCLVLAVWSGACQATSAPGSDPQGASATSTFSRQEVADFAVTFLYEQFWLALSVLDDEEPSQWRGALEVLVAEPELSRQLLAATDRRRRGVSLYGEPVSHVTRVEGAETTVAVLEDCQDASSTGVIDAAGRRTTGSRRTEVIATFTRPADYSRWQLSELTYPPGGC